MGIQSTRSMALSTPLGEDKLLLHNMSGYEELGRLFEFRIHALSQDHEIDLSSLLGEKVTVRLDLPEGRSRFFNGQVSRFSHIGAVGDYSRYELIVHPWFWFLTRNSDCRIFQNMTAPDIIKQVFRDRGFSDFEDQLQGNYREWEYCVQYRETDFNFVSRLMEQEGIFYYFTHDDDEHTLVLCDLNDAFGSVADYESIKYYPRNSQDRRDQGSIYDWSVDHHVQPGKIALQDYNFTMPSADIAATAETSRGHYLADMEIYDYPGEYTVASEGDDYARIRNQEVQSRYERVRGGGDTRGIMAGASFELDNYPRSDQNRKYLVVSANHGLTAADYGAGETQQENYQVSFNAISEREPFRPARTTTKPVVQGPQTAVVVGKSGEEIWCDEYGRVKVQFHWDREGGSDENSSCWVRVAQVWAGAKWGAMHIPRMGQEVIIEFLEGDPDRPIITGRVYNDNQMPPYDLPANQTMSGLKSRSSKEGGADNFNEIYFEDKKGEEEMYIHAEKDQNSVVENDQTELVQHDKMIRVDNDRRESIGRDRELLVERDKTEEVQNNKSIKVAVAHTEQIGANMSISVGSNLTESVAVNYAENVGAAMELTVGAALAITVGAAMSETVGGTKSESIGGSRSESVGGNRSVSVGGGETITVAKSRTIKVDKDVKETVSGKFDQTITKELIVKAKKIQLVAKDEISLKAGKAEMTLKKNGDITIKGKKINVKGSGDVIIKGSKILEN